MNGGTLGFMFTAKDLASGAFARQNKNVKALAANSQAAAAVYEQSMARMRRGAMMLGVAVVGLLVMTKVTKTFGEFQFALASAGAVMHATAGEMKMLERAAIDAGIATQFSPREAAEGLQSLGAAGLSAAKAVKVLNPVLDLAAASMGQLGVAGAAENVVGVLNAFSMQADRAGEVADKLTRISQMTNFQFRDFGVAISQAAAQAYSADQTFESMLATLGMLRNTNLHASAAATSYREAVRRLSGDKRAQKELSKLSIDVLDKETKKIRDLGSIMAELAPKLEKLNSKEKNLRATRIFGVRGMKVYSAFVAQYRKLVDEGVIVTGDWAGAHTRLVEGLKNSEGAAKKNRDALLKTAEGQRLLLKGSWETTQIMLGKLALPVVLPALKAFTTALNMVIKLLDMIPKPLRSGIAHFLGVGLAIKGVVGAFNMLRGVAGIAMLGRMATAAGDVGTAADTAAKKTGRLAQATGRLRAGVGSIAAGFGRWLPAIGVGVALLSAAFSYMRQKEAEEMRRQKQIRENIKLSHNAYRAAWKMAERLRGASARAADSELNAARKSLGAAQRVVARYRAQHFELTERIKQARAQVLKLTAEQGANTKEVRQATADYIKLTGQYEATSTALIAAEAAEAKFRLRRAKGSERQVLAVRVIANEYNKLRAMLAQYRRAELIARRDIRMARGKDRVLRRRDWNRDRAVARARIESHKARIARMALRYKLGDRDALQNKRRRDFEIREIALRRARQVTLAAPTARFMGVAGGARGRGQWDAAIRAGRIPAGLSPAQIPEFRRYVQLRGQDPSFGLDPSEIRRLQQMAVARPAAAPAAPAAARPAAPERIGPGRGAAEDDWIIKLGNMLFAKREEEVGLADVIARAIRDNPPQVTITMDGEKVATTVEGATARRTRQNDGTTTPTTTVQGAG
jgi:TP901 family phage tail tape measure protein